MNQQPANESGSDDRDYEAIFERLRDDEMRRHPSVKVIKILDENDPIEDDPLMAFLGYPGVNLISWNSDEALVYEDHAGKPNGGVTYATRLGTDENISTFVTIRLLELKNNPVLPCYLIATLLHEMGHVDDIEKGINLRLGVKVDSVAGEIYANRYAIRRMRRQNLLLPLGLLILNVLRQARDSPEDSVDREAAKQLSESEEFMQCVALANSVIDIEVSLKQM